MVCLHFFFFQLADMFANAILDHVDQYLSRVINITTTKVGQCHPMSQAYNATVVAVCNEILDPFVSFCIYPIIDKALRKIEWLEATPMLKIHCQSSLPHLFFLFLCTSLHYKFCQLPPLPTLMLTFQMCYCTF